MSKTRAIIGKLYRYKKSNFLVVNKNTRGVHRGYCLKKTDIRLAHIRKMTNNHETSKMVISIRKEYLAENLEVIHNIFL